MLKVTAKVGSQVTIPNYPGMVGVSSDPSILEVSNGPAGVTARAVRPGMAWVTVTFALDLKGMLQITVVA